MTGQKRFDKTEALAAVSQELLDELSQYAERIINKMARDLHIGQRPSGRETVHTAVLKALNAEQALSRGHAAIVNGRIQLIGEAKADPRVAEQYSDGLRFWDETKHDRDGFLRLVILSDIRAWAKQNASGTHVDVSEGVSAGAEELVTQSPEEDVGRRHAIEGFINSLDSHELKDIAEQILLRGAQTPDLMFHYGLSRSQVEKRIRKIMETAHQFSSSLKN